VNLQTAAHNIAAHYFKLPPGKPVAIACEPEKHELARALAIELEKLKHPTILAVLEGDNPTLRAGLQTLLENEAVALAVLASHSMWTELGLKERFILSNRQPSLVSKADPIFFDAGTPLESLCRLYSADPQSIDAFLDGLKRNLKNFTATHLTTPGGTTLTFTARAWQAWGWEMMTCPVEDTVQGKIVADAGVFFGRLSQPIELTVENGRLTGMRCPERNDEVFRQYRQWMMEALEDNPGNAQVAEVGIGANPGAQISEVVMESEAVRGTVHICFGDNSIFQDMGGKNHTGWHGGTVVLKEPHFESMV
jgi:leucyl aminopeptidase (aminopeptidase T)